MNQSVTATMTLTVVTCRSRFPTDPCQYETVLNDSLTTVVVSEPFTGNSLEDGRPSFVSESYNSTYQFQWCESLGVYRRPVVVWLISAGGIVREI